MEAKFRVNLRLLNLVVILVGFILLFLIYQAGVSGALYYDDYSNLGGLGEVSNTKEALKFVFSGYAGPLGRPIALASFLPHSSGWPNNSEEVLLVNIFIHCFNFCIVYLISRLILQKTTQLSSYRIVLAALSASLMWALLPILASASLIAIQRMTVLASFFGFLGLLGFVWAYKYSETKPKLAFVLQMGSIGFGTLIAVFTKESAALFPVYALVIDVLLVRNLSSEGFVGKLRRFCLLLPLIFIIYYISPININWFEVHDLRGFTPFERLNTQAIILWEYLLRAFLPQQPTTYGPFHDYYGLKEVGFTTGVAIMSWVVLLTAALFSFKRYRFIAFALFWFLAGHMIESTTVMLELYFEHRNYSALVGPCLVLTTCFWSVRGKLKNVLPLVQSFYILLLALISFSMISLWGQPTKAAEIWAIKHPGSARAVLHSVFQEMGLESNELHAENQNFSKRERYYNSLLILDRTKNICPDCINVRLQALLYSCLIETEVERKRRFIEILEMAPSADLNPGVVDMLFNLSELAGNDQCAPISYKEVVSLIERLEINRQFSLPVFGSKLLFIKAMAHQGIGDKREVYLALDAASKISPSALPILQFQVHFALENDDVKYAEDALQRRRTSNKINENVDKKEFESLQSLVEIAKARSGRKTDYK